MDVFEDTAAEQTPFASVDNTVVGYDQMIPGLNHVATTSSKVMSHAKMVFEYWKSRRQQSGNKPLHPALKFETHQESDDTDPYVCFRRREARQTRKTRARDVQSADKLKRLRRELEDGRQIILMSYEREMVKRELMNVERSIFEQRAKLKEMKIKLGIKNEDEDLINQKVGFQPVSAPSVLGFAANSLTAAEAQASRRASGAAPPWRPLALAHALGWAVHGLRLGVVGG
jgi:enhancer of polycomb-like protein